MDLYPYKFLPIVMEKIWGGRNLERLFARRLPEGRRIGESWELADLPQGQSVLANGPEAGKTLFDLTAMLGGKLLGKAGPMPGGRFPLLLKLLDANDILSLQVHPDAAAARRIGGGAAMKTECWYVLESRNGLIYKGVEPGATPQQFRQAIEANTVERLIQKRHVLPGEFHYLPAGTVHALGAGVVAAEIQTPSDTTYRVSDWGRGRESHVEPAMQCIHFEPPEDSPPGSSGATLAVTPSFTVRKLSAQPGQVVPMPAKRCVALMILSGDDTIRACHDGRREPAVPLRPGDTVLFPAGLRGASLKAASPCDWLEITLPEEQ